MSEHFLGSNKAFEILENLGLDPLNVGDFVHQINQTLVLYQEDLKLILILTFV